MIGFGESICVVALTATSITGRVVEGTLRQDVQLSTSPAGKHSAVQPEAVGGPPGTARVIWHDLRAGNWQVMFRSTSDWGTTWGRETALSRRGDARNVTLVSDGKDKLLVVWESFDSIEKTRRGSREGTRETDWSVLATASDDGGTTWLKEPVRLDPGLDWSGLVRATMDRDGTAYVAWSERVSGKDCLFFRRSLDGGKTWQAQQRMATAETPITKLGHTAIASDSAGHVYLACLSAHPGSPGLLLFRSDDRGEQWHMTKTPGERAVLSVLSVCSDDGSVGLVWIEQEGGISVALSKDFGQTWSRAPVRLSAPEKGKGLVTLPTQVAAGRNGRIAIAYADNRTGKLGAYVNVSLDGGKAWSDAISLNMTVADGYWRCDPQAIWDAEGRLYVSWLDPKYGYLDVLLNCSEDGGKTWLKEPVRLNASPPGAADSKNVRLVELEPGVVGAVWDNRWLGSGAPTVFFNRHSSVRHKPALVQSPPEPSRPDRIVPQLKLENDRVALTWRVEGNRLVLDEVLPRQTGVPIRLADGSGDWQILFRSKDVYTESVVVSPTSPTRRTLVLETARSNGSRLDARWSGVTELEGSPLGFTVETTWELPSGAVAAETSIRVSITNPGSVPFYVSEVLYPRVIIRPLGEPDCAVLPFRAGFLMRDPFGTGEIDKVLLGGPIAEPGHLATPVFAYYGEKCGSCLYVANTDVLGTHKTYKFEKGDGTFEIAIKHVPENIFDRKQVEFGYRVLIGGLKGDWVDVAEEYRTFLSRHAPYYRGPVGSPTNSMPEPLKKIVATVHEGAGNDSDSLDAIARDLMQMTRYLGPGLYGRWYGCNWPDRFDGFYDRGYLPGKPTFHSAAHESQRRGDIIVAPYIQGSAALYYPLEIARIEHPTEVNLGTYQSAVEYEDGRQMLILGFAHPMAMECTGSRWWNEYLPRLVSEIIEKTGIAGIYVDYFQWSAPCYAHHHDHAPGGGSFYVQGKVNLIKSIRKQVAALRDGPGYVAVSSEAVGGVPFTEECHVMFDDPLSGLANSKGTVSIPLFRMVCDNIKMSMITGVSGEFARGMGFACWEVTNRVLTFGQVLGFGSSLAEFFPALTSRDVAEYYEYMGRVATFLRDQDFFKYHNGTLTRMPEVSVKDADDLVKIVCNTDKATEPGPRGLSYYTGAVNTGMFRAPNGDYAVAVANPWIGDPKRTLDVTVTVDRSRYRDFPQRARCIFHPNERDALPVETSSQPTVLKTRLKPGQIAFWEWVK